MNVWGEEMNKNINDNALPDYNSYSMSWEKKALYFLKGAAFIYAFAFIFYRSHIFCVLLCPLAFLYPRIETRNIIEKRKYELNIQFRDMLYSLSSSLSVGKSLELAFKDILNDLELLYPYPDTPIIREVEYIVRKIDMNETVEEALCDFAGRVHLEDVDNFVDVLRICKRTGGNIVEVLKNTANIINDKIEIKHEINTLLAQRKLEQKVLNLLPPVMVLIISASSYEYIRPVFTTIPGRLVMTIAVLLLTAAYFISKKIMDIKV